MISAVNSKLGLARRVFPMLFFIPLCTFYNKNIGMYGVHRSIDDILELMVGDDRIQVKEEDCRVRQLAKQFVKDKNIIFKSH